MTEELSFTIKVPDVADMQQLGARIASLVQGGDVLLLSGPLGAGKTTFAQGFGSELHISEPIVSPTFTVARELTDVLPMGLQRISSMLTHTGSEAIISHQDKIRWIDFLMNWNHWVWMKSLNILANRR